MDNKHELTVEDLISGKKELLGFDPTDERECMKRVAENGFAISMVDPDIITDNMAMCAVMSTPYAIQFIPKGYITNALMMAAVCLEPAVAGLMVKMGIGNEDIYIEAVRRDWRVMEQLVPVATHQICIEAVMTYGLALQYVPMQFRDLEICSLAVRNKPSSICYATTQNEDMAMIAIVEDRDNLKYVIQTDKICERACRIDGTALQFIRNKKPKYCAIALSETNDAAQYIPESAFEEVVKIMNETNKATE